MTRTRSRRSPKQALAAARRKSTESRARMLRIAAIPAWGYGLGKAVGGDGILASIPSILGMPKLASAGLVGYGVALFVPGKYTSPIAEALGDAASAIASFQLGSGDTVSGGEVGATGDIESMERQLDALESASGLGVGAGSTDDDTGGEFEDEMMALEEEASGGDLDDESVDGDPDSIVDDSSVLEEEQ